MPEGSRSSRQFLLRSQGQDLAARLHTIEAFNQNDPMAYEELAEVIDRVTPEPDAN